MALFIKLSAVAANCTYYCKTKPNPKVRIFEHWGIAELTGKSNKSDDDSSIKKHLLFWDHSPDYDGFFILATNNNVIRITLMESLLINRDHPVLNKNKQSLILEILITEEKSR